MNEPDFKRARTDEAKAKRRDDILSACAHVLEERGIDRTTLKAIADQAGVVKSNLYRYFESREEILIRLLLSDLDEVLGQLKAVSNTPLPLEQGAVIFAHGFSSNPRLCMLFSQLAPTLEHNISGETLIEVKKSLYAHGFQAAELLGQLVPELNAPECEEITQMVVSYIAGAWPITNPGPNLQKIHDLPEFRAHKRSFEQVLQRGVLVIMRGVQG